MTGKESVKVTYNSAVEQGVTLCREGNWDEGLVCLNHVLQTSKANSVFPGVFYSYLGYGIALKENRVREGLILCQKAVDMEFYEPSHFLNLARCHMLAKNRRGVARCLDRGLELDPDHRGLLKLQQQFGIRKPPVLRFLKRDNPLNIYLGRMRHRYQAKVEPPVKGKAQEKLAV